MSAPPDPGGPLGVAVRTVIAAAVDAAAHGAPVPGEARTSAIEDAGGVVAEVITSDDALSDREEAAWEAAFATPATLARLRSLTGQPASASPTLAALAGHDRVHGGSEAWVYYQALTELAFEAAALRDVPSTQVLATVQGLCNRFLAVLDEAGLPRPGRAHPHDDGDNMGAVTGDGAGDSAGPSAGAAGPPKTSGAAGDEPGAPPPSLDQLMAELDGLTGLAAVKEEVKVLTQVLRIRRLRTEAHLPVADMSHHLVFVGNPGTGKTTVARIIAGIYRALGVVTKGQLVDVDRSALVAGYVGQTAIRTADVVRNALGGVLLIDEAYALAEGGPTDFGQEAIDELVKAMEDHRRELAVIVAGYPAEMTDFLDANPGLRSRFPKTIAFPDYSTDELVAIFQQLGASSRYVPDEAALATVRDWFEHCPREKGFGNARVARNLFEEAQRRQAWRLRDVPAPTTDQLSTLTADDIPPPGSPE